MVIPIELISLDGFAYIGPIYIGENQTAIVDYDTGSGWVTVAST